MAKDRGTRQGVVRINFDELVEEMRRASEAGDKARIPQAPAMYQMSPSQPGMIERILEDGTREIGIRKDGEFVPVESKK